MTIFNKNVLLGLVAVFAMTSTAQANTIIDFDQDAAGNAITAGQIIDNEYAAFGVTIQSDNQSFQPTIAFDSSNPTGGDFDLGTPNVTFGGPGIGAGGEAGQPGENAVALNNVLIISEDGDLNDPDDDAGGGVITFDFASPVTFFRIGILDVDDNNSAGVVRLLDNIGGVISQLAVLPLGDNSVQYVSMTTAGISSVEVVFPGSGAITGLEFAAVPEPSSLALLLLGGAALALRKKTA